MLLALTATWARTAPSSSGSIRSSVPPIDCLNGTSLMSVSSQASSRGDGNNSDINSLSSDMLDIILHEDSCSATSGSMGSGSNGTSNSGTSKSRESASGTSGSGTGLGAFTF